MNEYESERAFREIFDRLISLGYNISYDVFYGTLTLNINGGGVYKCRTWNNARAYIHAVEQGVVLEQSKQRRNK